MAWQANKKAVAIIAIFLLFYLCFGAWNYANYGKVNNTQDFDFHFKRVQGIDENPKYLWGYHVAFALFGGNQFLFYAVNVFLICVLIPGLLFCLKKNWWVVAIYFCGIPLAHQLLYGATYPQALILAFLLIYFVWREKHGRDPAALMVVTVPAVLTHNLGLALFAGVWGLETVTMILEYRGLRKCFKESISKYGAVGWIGPSKMIGLKGAIELFFLQLPIPVLIYGFKGLKSLFYVALAVVSIAGTPFDFRTVSIAQLILVFGASEAIKERPKWIKSGFVVFLIAQVLFYLLDYGLGTWKYIVLN